MQRRLRISGSTLRARSLVDKAVVAAAVEHHVVPLLAARRVRVLVEATFPMDRAAEAYERFAQGGKLGKIVLVADPGRSRGPVATRPGRGAVLGPTTAPMPARRGAV